MERDISGGSGKISVIVAAAVALASLISLIPGCLREFLCLLLQQLIHRFFHTAADQFLDLTLDNLLVQLYNFLRHGLLSPFRMVCRNFILPEICKPCPFFPPFILRNLSYLIHLWRARAYIPPKIPKYKVL